MQKNIQMILEQLEIEYKKEIPIGRITRMWQVEILPLVAWPDSIDKLRKISIFCLKNGIAFDTLGGLTNTYLCSSYSPELVILTGKVKDKIDLNNGIITVGCGYNLTKLSKDLTNRGIDGYVGFVGIPGTVGGATINNSGAFRSEMKNVVVGCHIIDSQGLEKYMTNVDLQYSPRHSILKGKRDFVLLSIDLITANMMSVEKLEQELNMYISVRKNKIDGKRKSLGSIFCSFTITEIMKRHPIAFFFKRLLNIPNKFLFHSSYYSTWLQFVLLGCPRLARHCDSINRFCWNKKTTEEDFFDYLKTMQKLAGGNLIYEIEIRR